MAGRVVAVRPEGRWRWRNWWVGLEVSRGEMGEMGEMGLGGRDVGDVVDCGVRLRVLRALGGVVVVGFDGPGGDALSGCPPS